MDINEIYLNNYREYAFYTVKDRAIADIRDGLKPVHRRIINEMLKMGITSKKPYVKVSKIVGQVMGNAHPHGDTSITGGLVTLNTPWKNTLPIIDIQGNNGSVLGDKNAAARYIEARLTPFGEYYGKNLDPEIIRFEPNYDDTLMLPTYLPAPLPYWLINGSNGIAVGVASDIPPHNPQCVIDTYKLYLENPDTPLDLLVNTLQGPDFPTKGIIVNKDNLINIYKTGKGRVEIEGRIRYDESDKSLHIYEIPYTISGEVKKFVSKLNQLSTDTKNKKGEVIKAKLPFIADVNDYSGNKGIDITIKLKKGTNIDYAISELYNKTKLRSSLRIEMIGLNDKKIKKYNLLTYLEEFTEEQLKVSKFVHLQTYRKLLNEIHIIEGYEKLHQFIDEVIQCAKVIRNKEELITILQTGELDKNIISNIPKTMLETISKFDFSEIQATKIANLPIYKINNLNYTKYKNEKIKLTQELQQELSYIKSEKLRRQELIDNLPNLDTPRLTEICNKELATIELPKETWYYKVVDNQLDIRNRKTDGFRPVDNNDRLFAIASDGYIWNIYLDTLGAGKHLLSKLLPNIDIINVVDKNDNILIRYTTNQLKIIDPVNLITKSRSTKVNATNNLTICYAENIIGDIYINNEHYTDIPLQGIRSKGKRYNLSDDVVIEFKTQGAVDCEDTDKDNQEDAIIN